MIGFLNIYKPEGMTSSKVVVKIRKKFNIARIGHFGTLDPMATGVLPIAIGKATRLFDYYLDKYKTYIATFQFGYLTNTLDREGEILDKTDILPSISLIEEKIKEFLGFTMQVPPDFSAKQINGVRAYKLARNGETVELKPKKIEITNFELLEQNENNVYKFSITCSSGTYIRSIARDLGYKCGSLCTMIALERVESGIFNLTNSVTLEELLNKENIQENVIDVLEVFPNMQVISLKQEDYNKIKNGINIKDTYSVENYTFAYFENTLFGVLEKVGEYLKLKTYLME